MLISRFGTGFCLQHKDFKVEDKEEALPWGKVFYLEDSRMRASGFQHRCEVPVGNKEAGSPEKSDPKHGFPR